MKKTIAAALMSAFLFMGATCTGVQISGQAVIDLVHQTCGIVVPLADIAALVSANPALNSVAAVANAICNAFQMQSAKVAQSSPTASPTVSGTLIIDGVLVHYAIK